jgi:Sodium/hydrogen exchanger family
VSERSERRALALDLKYGVTDVNGWQTAYGYDDGASRNRFVEAVRVFEADLADAGRSLTDPQEQRLLEELSTRFEQFLRLDDAAFAALERGDEERVKRIFLGPELRLFDAMAARADQLARYEARRAAATERAFDDSREESRRGLIAVALAGIQEEHAQDVRHFAFNLADIVTLIVFMVLGANIPFDQLGDHLLPALAVLATLLLVARPLTILLSTMPDRGARWSREELTFMCWTRETGVVPAALVGVLAGLGVPETEVFASVVALAVVLTLLLQALPARWLAERLGLLEPRTQPVAVSEEAAA